MIYLDNAATTPLRPEVFHEMEQWLTTEYGNPSSHHLAGRRAAEALINARETIAEMIHARPDEIFFTSGGSEANTWAVMGLYGIGSYGHVIMSSIEHHSLLNIDRTKRLINVDEHGRIDLQDLGKSSNIQSDTPVVCVMMVNNEIGTIQPIDIIDQSCMERSVLFHVDAVQAFGHIPIDVTLYKAMSTMSASAHKIGGPKGVGFLYISKPVQEFYHPLIAGGQQERGMRGGTENVAGIVGFAKACALAQRDMEKMQTKYNMLAYDFLKTLQDKCNVNFSINGYELGDARRVSHILNLTFENTQAEILTELLSEQEVCVSSGSACNSDSDEPSHVLTAIGLDEEMANNSVRVSFGYQNTEEEILRAAEIIANDVNMLKE